MGTGKGTGAKCPAHVGISDSESSGEWSEDDDTGDFECMCERRLASLWCSSRTCANARSDQRECEEEQSGEADLSDDSSGCPREGRSALPPPEFHLEARRRRKLARILKSVEQELLRAWAKNVDLDFFVKEVELEPSYRSVGPQGERYPGVDSESVAGGPRSSVGPLG